MLYSAKLDVSVEFGSERREGFTQYQIKFLTVEEEDLQIFGNSRLKFPFTSYFSGGYVHAEYMGFCASAGYWQEYRSSKDDRMEDFDWLSSNLGDYIPLAYGRTTPDTDMYYLQFRLEYEFRVKSIEFGPFVDYTKLHSEFMLTDLSQFWYYDLQNGTEYDPPRDTMVEGEVLYYEQDLHMPLFGADFGITAIPEKLKLNTKLGVSPFVSVDDYDDHIIRADSLEAWNSGDGGTSWLFELGAAVGIFDGLWISGEFGYNDYSVNTLGTQRLISDDTGEYVVASGINSQVRGVMRKFRFSISYLFGL
ncbi:MAG TPA: hypothetical protein ENO22_01255 [candidate division Zixibacteria bacterium]|nr:hypothetical protein [candidate division Zixibacteria bacterium]